MLASLFASGRPPRRPAYWVPPPIVTAPQSLPRQLAAAPGFVLALQPLEVDGACFHVGDPGLQITRTDGEIDSLQLVGGSPAELLYLERRLAGVGIVSDRLYADHDHAQKPDVLFGLGLRPADAKTVSAVLDADHVRFQRTDEDADVA